MQKPIKMLPGPWGLTISYRPRNIPWHLGYFTSGRVALKSVLCTTAAESVVLVPAYHCNVVRDACEWARCKVVYYRVNERLEPQKADLIHLIGSHRPKAILLIHYFGKIFNVRWLSDVCRKQGVTLVHDCAHLDVLEPSITEKLKSLDGWVISSPRKYYPIYDGGVCFSNVAGKTPSSPAVNVLHELRALKWQATRPPNAQLSTSKRGGQGAARENHNYEGPHDKFKNPCRMSFSAKVLVRHTDVVQLHRRREQVHFQIASFISSQCKKLSLFQHDASQAYCVTVLVDDPNIHYELRQRGIDAWRWEDVPNGVCGVTDHYRNRLVQLPCHQGITDSDLAAIRRILSDY